MTGTHDDIFTVKHFTASDGQILANVVVNESSDILNGHFPGQPVVPGACMLQLVKDVLKGAVERKLQLVKADNIKFMSMIVPGGQKELQLVISYKMMENDAYFVQA